MTIHANETKSRWKHGILTRDFIYCPMFTGNPLAGVKYTKRDYQRAIDHSRSVARDLMARMQNDPQLIRYFCRRFEHELKLYNVAVVRAVTPACWGSSEHDAPNFDGRKAQVFTRHCTPLHVWKIADYLRRQADKIEAAQGGV